MAGDGEVVNIGDRRRRRPVSTEPAAQAHERSIVLEYVLAGLLRKFAGHDAAAQDDIARLIDEVERGIVEGCRGAASAGRPALCHDLSVAARQVCGNLRSAVLDLPPTPRGVAR